MYIMPNPEIEKLLFTKVSINKTIKAIPKELAATIHVFPRVMTNISNATALKKEGSMHLMVETPPRL